MLNSEEVKMIWGRGAEGVFGQDKRNWVWDECLLWKGKIEINI